jgi:hypothetical protein
MDNLLGRLRDALIEATARAKYNADCYDTFDEADEKWQELYRKSARHELRQQGFLEGDHNVTAPGGGPDAGAETSCPVTVY